MYLIISFGGKLVVLNIVSITGASFPLQSLVESSHFLDSQTNYSTGSSRSYFSSNINDVTDCISSIRSRDVVVVVQFTVVLLSSGNLLFEPDVEVVLRPGLLGHLLHLLEVAVAAIDKTLVNVHVDVEVLLSLVLVESNLLQRNIIVK